MIYLDSNATTEIDPEVLDAMLPFLRQRYANPSAGYASARIVRQAIEEARGEVAALLNAQPGEIVFTACGTESINAVHLSAAARLPNQKFLAAGATEHAAGIECAARWGSQGGEVLWAPADGSGVVTAAGLASVVRPGHTALVSIMWANNETGVVQPVEELVEIAHGAGALFHTDAVQAAGKALIDVAAVPVDYLSISGHKMHAPKGVGALFISERVRFEPMLLGGGQEAGRRSGTENVAGIAGLGKAAALMRRRLERNGQDGITRLRDAFEGCITTALPEAVIHGAGAPRLGTTSSICFPGIDAAGLLILLDGRGICCAAGSACHSAGVHPSHVLQAMGFDAAHAASTLRFSFSRFNTAEEVEEAAGAVIRSVHQLRAMWALDEGPVTRNDE